MQIIYSTLIIILTITLTVDIANSARRRNLPDLITFSFILVYGITRPLHLQFPNIIQSNFYVFGISGAKFPTTGYYLYVFSYFIFYIIYKTLTKRNNNIMDVEHLTEPKANNGIFVFSLIVYVFIYWLRSKHPIFVSLDMVQIFIVMLIHSTIPLRSGWITYVLSSVLMIMHFLESNERRDMLVMIMALLAMGYHNAVVRKYFANIFVPLFCFVCLAIIAITMRSGLDRPSEQILASVLIKKIETELDYSIVADTTAYAMESAYMESEYFYGESLLKPFLYFVPRSIMPEKPETISRTVAKAYFPGFYRHGGSTPVGLMGEAFLNFSFLGVVLFSLLYAKYASIIFTLSYSKSIVTSQFGTALTAGSFYLLRGPIDTMLIGFLSLVIFFIYTKTAIMKSKL